MFKKAESKQAKDYALQDYRKQKQNFFYKRYIICTW